ncbi:cystatin-like [Silurus meridionalis]|uniref:cystatin-like n=1 Tax=Silurus meridionalis TaxID=175797 RepID=UPI001EEA5193|nr:cystatin-like [Silurus meridionalis]KAI5108514.1 cystatin C precursor [Silurus meridionalis]
MIVKVAVLLLALCLALAKDNLVGAPTNSNMNDPQVQEALSFAVAQYNEDSGSLYTSHVLHVIKVQTQVVAGVKYIFTVKMATTSCLKGAAKNTCAIVAKPVPRECTLAVWSQPWLNSMVLVENTC